MDNLDNRIREIIDKIFETGQMSVAFDKPVIENRKNIALAEIKKLFLKVANYRICVQSVVDIGKDYVDALQRIRLPEKYDLERKIGLVEGITMGQAEMIATLVLEDVAKLNMGGGE